MSKRILTAALLMLTLTSCGYECQYTAPFAKEAGWLSSRAEACLLDVRDNGTGYQESAICQSLGDWSMTYIEAGGVFDDATAQGAQKMAWIAAALSNAMHPDNPTFNIW